MKSPGEVRGAVARRSLVADLLRSPEPSVRWRTRVRVLEEPRTSPRVRALEDQVRASPRVRSLLSHANAPHREDASRSVYAKWQGLQWVLASLADLGYPRGDRAIVPLRDRVQTLWTRESYRRSYRADSQGAGYGHPAVPVMQGRARRCASQQGNALFATSVLGLTDERSALLAELLRGWQWPDGGWNCDRDPEADTSSFCETLTPMEGLAAYAEERGDREARAAAPSKPEVVGPGGAAATGTGARPKMALAPKTGKPPVAGGVAAPTSKVIPKEPPWPMVPLTVVETSDRGRFWRMAATSGLDREKMLILSPEAPGVVNSSYGMHGATIYRLSRTEAESNVNPGDADRLGYLIESHMEKGSGRAVIIDGIAMIVDAANIRTARRLVELVHEMSEKTSGAALIWVNPDTMGQVERRQLEEKAAVRRLR